MHKDTSNGSVITDWKINYTYDQNGNLLATDTVQYDNEFTGSQKSYTYDTWGRLTGYSDSLGETASYSYYSDGLRASKTIGSNTTKYYYNGDNVINETLNGNNYATNVLGVNGYISRRQNGTTGYLFKDAHGDVLAAYSSTTNKIADYSYTAWGETQTENETSSFTNNPLRYCGEYYDYESGMTYLRARYYDSEIKRFISEDPAKDGLNWYVYGNNNPIMNVDPTGKYSLQDIFGVTRNYGVEVANQVNDAATRASNNAINKALAWGYVDEYGNVNAHNNRADAMRRFQWNAVMSQEVGYDVSKYVSDRYEINEVKGKGLFRKESNGIVRMRIGQEELMDLWNNSVGRTLSQDSDLNYMNYDELFYYAENNHLLITDVNNAFGFYGINDYVDRSTYTIGVDYDMNKETITVMKEGLPDMELKVGISSWW